MAGGWFNWFNDLKFVDGKLDEFYIYEVVKDKRNIFCQLMILKSIFAQYKKLIGNHIPSKNVTRTTPLYVSNHEHVTLPVKSSKYFYRNLIN